MKELIDKIRIKSTTDIVWDKIMYFFQGTENYKIWHKDHISCYWKKGKDFLPGSILIVEEIIHGKKHRLGFKIIEYEKEKVLKYKMLFPFTIICFGGYFQLDSKGNETEFIAQLGFRQEFLTSVLFKKNIEALKTHMKEEGQNLKYIIEENKL